MVQRGTVSLKVEPELAAMSGRAIHASSQVTIGWLSLDVVLNEV